MTLKTRQLKLAFEDEFSRVAQRRSRPRHCKGGLAPVPAGVLRIRIQLARLELIGTRTVILRLKRVLKEVPLTRGAAQQVGAELAHRKADIKRYGAVVYASTTRLRGLGLRE